MKNGTLLLGFDIGGTKTAAVLGDLQGRILGRSEMNTPAQAPFEAALEQMTALADSLLEAGRQRGLPAPQAVSVSVGGPLEIERGIVLSPPHLPTWDQAPLKERLEAHFRLPVCVEHDGNAGALSEYYFGAGRGARNLVFLTTGTGMGAGIILEGQVIRGTTDTAGEVGHIRLAEDGPEEYGKAGSWEGYCSGAGLAQLARRRAPDHWPPAVSTQQVVQRALEGDAQAVEIVEEMGEWLGKGLALLVDMLNPQVIVLGTLGVVLGDLLIGPARRVMLSEALERPAQACRVLPAGLGGRLGDVCALAAAIHAVRCGRLRLPGLSPLDQVVAGLHAGIEVRRRTIETLSADIAASGLRIVETLKSGGKVLLCGNGGSAATAQHLAGELVGRFRAERRPLPALALTADSSVVSCIGNDYSFDEVFARQVLALAQPGDLVIGFTTSGRSPNVLQALRAARQVGAQTIALTGEKGLSEDLADLTLAAPCALTARIQEEHDAILHAWCEIVDSSFINTEGTNK